MIRSRHELKYLVSEAQAMAIAEHIRPFMRPDHHSATGEYPLVRPVLGFGRPAIVAGNHWRGSRTDTSCASEATAMTPVRPVSSRSSGG